MANREIYSTTVETTAISTPLDNVPLYSMHPDREPMILLKSSQAATSSDRLSADADGDGETTGACVGCKKGDLEDVCEFSGGIEDEDGPAECVRISNSNDASSSQESTGISRAPVTNPDAFGVIIISTKRAVSEEKNPGEGGELKPRDRKKHKQRVGRCRRRREQARSRGL
ncbi:hypothetical protein B296_00030552 [Ensete ventricosum]|uniref:Uncharacterized protein n=1 Tax=Ensete ventricosum TaxID=4639 RepID=A0A426Y191_ENSVE|nr:hypothetical protein B296_00030552 [Ensete ventricosum]